MDYVIEMSTSAMQLQKMVRARMNDGYTVQGGLHVVYFPKNEDHETEETCFYQAMVKYEES